MSRSSLSAVTEEPMISDSSHYPERLREEQTSHIFAMTTTLI